MNIFSGLFVSSLSPDLLLTEGSYYAWYSVGETTTDVLDNHFQRRMHALFPLSAGGMKPRFNLPSPSQRGQSRPPSSFPGEPQARVLPQVTRPCSQKSPDKLLQR
jgi:hypothetical protein